MFERKKNEPLSPANKPILGNFNLTAQLPNGRSIQLAGYMFEGESLESLNYRMDTCQEAIERQRARCEIPELEAKREQTIKALDDYREHMAALDDKRLKGQSISSQERMALQNMKVNIKRMGEEIEKGDAAIAEAKRKAGVG